TVTVAGDGVPVPVTDGAGNPVLVPLGARCWGTEDHTGGATAVTIDHHSFLTGVTISADAEAGLQPLTITATNTYDPGITVVTKVVVNAPDPDAVYTFTIECTITESDGTISRVPLLSGQSPVELGNGATTSFAALLGATCTITEVTTGAFVASFSEEGGIVDATPDGSITIGPNNAITVTNTFPPPIPPTTTPPPGAVLPQSGPSPMVVLLASLLAAFAATLVVGRRRPSTS
ncbi:MAG TPA: DUF5979 domain-containing protein, partial [Candidatus Limnocylindrales bacterium]